MAGLLSSVSAAIRYLSNVSEDGVAKGTLKSLEDQKLQLIRADGSMMKLLGKYIVEPIAVVSKDLKDVEELDHILGLHMDMFTGYYMQAFDVLKDRYNLQLNVVVDTLATDNGGLERVLVKGLEAGITFSGENDDTFDYLGNLLKISELSTEAPSDAYRDEYDKQQAQRDFVNKNVENILAEDKARTRAKEDTKNAAKRYDEHLRRKDLLGVGKGRRHIFANKDIYSTPSALAESHKDLLVPNAIQRTIEVTTEVFLTEPGSDGVYHSKTIIIPITIKLGVIFADEESIINAIDINNDSNSFSERWEQYESGAISMTDFLLASDLVKKYKKNKLRDSDALITIMKSRELSANSKIVSNSFAGFEKYYNMYVISPAVKARIEKEIRAKLTTPKGKDKFLEKAMGLSVTVVDPDYERLVIMLKDIRGKTDLSFKAAIKKDSKGSDYSEIIKALMANKPPAF